MLHHSRGFHNSMLSGHWCPWWRESQGFRLSISSDRRLWCRLYLLIFRIRMQWSLEEFWCSDAQLHLTIIVPLQNSKGRHFIYLFNLGGGSTSVIILVSANSFGQATVYIFPGHLNPFPVPSEYSHSGVRWAEVVLPVFPSSLTCHFKGFYFSDDYIFYWCSI